MLARRAFGNPVFGFVLSGYLELVIRTRTVRTFVDALAASYAKVIFIEDQAVRALVRRPVPVADLFAVGCYKFLPLLGVLRTDLDARRNPVFFVSFAVIATLGQEYFLTVGVLAHDIVIDNSPPFPKGNPELRLAGHGACPAADTPAQVEDHRPPWGLSPGSGRLDGREQTPGSGTGCHRSCRLEHVAS
jgi:hypothetical protein